MKKAGRVFVVAGPSGAGKGTLIRKVLSETPGVHYAVSATTRAPRQGEVNGKDYYFLGEEEFERLIEQGEFLESEEVYGNRYGTLKSEVRNAVSSGRDVLIEVDVKGALTVRSQLAGALLVFIMPPSMEELESRLRKRGTDSESEIGARIEVAPWEVETGESDCDVVIVNSDVEEAADELARVLRGEQV
ncbi:MAG: guanylate kinase [Actinobacteria bacterium]|nr:guanylate kinase [Actinomycetota bacterium]MBU4179451.1 guanylate kinase [Actinomycetota bacterium]MBU4218814.1 guanylate kinase [Actinomycetota bacterium]MBU4360154.1 guanylate kinase [Actinomycetota bacterium]MBU4391091.1 guanylate kinase [Actinomycetota bacterium]